MSKKEQTKTINTDYIPTSITFLSVRIICERIMLRFALNKQIIYDAYKIYNNSPIVYISNPLNTGGDDKILPLHPLEFEIIADEKVIGKRKVKNVP